MTRTPEVAPVSRPPLGLLLGFDEGATALVDVLERRGGCSAEEQPGLALEAFLLAAGLNQIVDETLHREVPVADLAALAAPRLLPSRLGRLVAGASERLGDGAVAIRERGRLEPRLLGLKRCLTASIDGLVDDLSGAGAGAPDLAALVDAAREPPAPLRRTVVRPPTSFWRLDQRPADMLRLAHAVARRWPDRRRAILVLGLRTSGSYLGPLYAGGLRALGYANVGWESIRPGERRLAHEREAVRRAIVDSALVLVADDPPRTGRQLDGVARELLRSGVRASDLLLLLALAGPDASVPAPLEGYERVVLPWSEWEIHARLQADAVRADLAALLAGRSITVPTEDGAETVTVGAVTGLHPAAPATEPDDPRGHLRRRLRFTFVEPESGREREHHVVAEGAGLGHFSAPWVQAQRELGAFFTDVYGVVDGIVYRSWVPDAWLVAPDDGADCGEALGARIATYVARRRERTRVPRDLSVHAHDGRAAWERCARMLSASFGRPYARPLMDAAAKRLLRVPSPSLPDHAPYAGVWARVPPEGALRKTAVALGYSYDPVASLAIAGADWRERAGDPGAADAFARQLARTYERLTEEPVGAERWLLHQLLHHWERLGGLTSPDEIVRVRGAIERGVRDYVASACLGDLRVAEAGELCAVDIDGVLESLWLSAPSPTPLSLLALRALNRHGYRAVLASGRSLGEVRERCRAYRLPGGVAEYGAAIYVRGRAVAFLSEAERSDLARLRAALAAVPGVHLDLRYQHSIRAHRAHPDGRLTGLEPELIATLLVDSAVAARIQAVRGGGQTDFVATRVSKGTGLRELARALASAADGPPAIALAVGNSTPDIPMLGVARVGCVTANANAGNRAAAVAAHPSVRLLRRPFQAGLLEAVELLLGHTASRCPTCAIAPVAPDAELLLAILALRSTPRRMKLTRGLAIAASLSPAARRSVRRQPAEPHRVHAQDDRPPADVEHEVDGVDHERVGEREGFGDAIGQQRDDRGGLEDPGRGGRGRQDHGQAHGDQREEPGDG